MIESRKWFPALHNFVNFVIDKDGNLNIIPKLLSGNNSVVEYDLAKVGVAGSNPVSRSIFFVAAWPSGKAKVCKTFIHRFESGRRLQFYDKRPAGSSYRRPLFLEKMF